MTPETAPDAKLSIVMPAHNEADVLNETLLEVVEVMRSTGTAFEVIVVDDGSTDETWRIVARDHRGTDEIRGIRLSRCFGKEAAMLAGLDDAAGDLILVMDGDLQHPPEIIPAMLELLRRDDADIVNAVKTKRTDQKWAHKLASRFFNYIFTSFTGFDLADASDFKLFNRRVLSAMQSMPERNTFFRGMSAWVGFKQATLPFDVRPREGGKTKWSFFSLLKLAFTAITSFSSSILHLITVSGILFLLFAVILGVQTLYMKATGASIDGFTTVILLLLITGSALMLGIGIMGEYIGRIYEEVKQRPRYIIFQKTDAPRS